MGELPARQLEKCRYYYVKRQLAAGKTPAHRELVAPERGATDTLLAGIRRSASGALVRALSAVWAFWGKTSG